MSDGVCTECGEPLKVDEEWILRDADLLGTEATGPISEAYIHRECASPGHVDRILRVAEATNE